MGECLAPSRAAAERRRELGIARQPLEQLDVSHQPALDLAREARGPNVIAHQRTRGRGGGGPSRQANPEVEIFRVAHARVEALQLLQQGASHDHRRGEDEVHLEELGDRVSDIGLAHVGIGREP